MVLYIMYEYEYEYENMIHRYMYICTLLYCTEYHRRPQHNIKRSQKEKQNLIVKTSTKNRFWGESDQWTLSFLCRLTVGNSGIPYTGKGFIEGIITIITLVKL
jgi:hypothetical protein